MFVQAVAFGEGHNSWVMRVQFDPWSCGEATSTAGPPGAPPTIASPLLPAAQHPACCHCAGCVGQLALRQAVVWWARSALGLALSCQLTVNQRQALMCRLCAHATCCVHAGSPANQVHEKLYRLGSVAQDTSLCLWDLVMEEDPYCTNSATGGTGGLK